MTLVTIVQARMGSTRLPGKVLLKVGERTILEHVLHRIELCPADTGTVVVATSVHLWDDEIADLCHSLGVECYRSSEHDVLNRYYQAALRYGAERVLRVTADCPLLCPELTAAILAAAPGPDYVTFDNVPLGLTPELITMPALYRCWHQAWLRDDREHVTLYALNHGGFDLRFLQPDDRLFDRHHWRLTIDTTQDLRLLQSLYRATSGRVFEMSTEEIVAMVDRDVLMLALAEAA